MQLHGSSPLTKRNLTWGKAAQKRVFFPMLPLPDLGSGWFYRGAYFSPVFIHKCPPSFAHKIIFSPVTVKIFNSTALAMHLLKLPLWVRPRIGHWPCVSVSETSQTTGTRDMIYSLKAKQDLFTWLKKWTYDFFRKDFFQNITFFPNFPCVHAVFRKYTFISIALQSDALSVVVFFF